MDSRSADAGNKGSGDGAPSSGGAGPVVYEGAELVRSITSSSLPQSSSSAAVTCDRVL